MRWYLPATPILDLTIKKQMPRWQLPLQQFFLKSISASSGNAKSKAPNKPQLWCMLLPDDWVSLQKVINSTARLPKPSEAWHARQGSAVGTAGGPCQLQIRISSSAPLQLPTPFCQEGTWRRKDRKQESGCLCPGPPPVYSLLSPAPLRLHTWKGHCLSHTESPFWF